MSVHSPAQRASPRAGPGERAAGAVAERPRVLANCAISLDGRLAYAGGARARLSGPEDLVRVQRLRLSVDGILIGVGTVLADNPSLRIHRELLGEAPDPSSDGARAGPWRVILDSQGRTPPGAAVLDGRQPTIVLTSQGCHRTFPPTVQSGAFGKSRVLLRPALKWLVRLGLRTLLVEGGAEVLSSFLREGLVDQLTVYVAPVVIGGRTAPPMVGGPETSGPEQLVGLRLLSAERLGPGVVLTYEPTVPESVAD